MDREVSIRHLRNDGGEIVAELHPLVCQPLSAAALIERAGRLPPMDPEALRKDIDELMDTSL